MEETLQQDLEYKNSDGDQGGIGRRLRDRDLLRRRKAEAEEKETNQWVLGMENQRKRSRAQDKSGRKRRGRPRKTDPTPVIEEETAVTQEAPVVEVVPEPAEVIPDQIPPLTSLTAVETQSAPVLESVQSPVFAPILTYPAPDTAPVQDAAPAPEAVSVPAQSQNLDPAEIPLPPSAPPQVESIYTGPQTTEAFDQILIEDLGPDEEEDIASSEDKTANEDLSGTMSIKVPEPSKINSIPTLSSPPVSQEYLPGNS